MAKSKSFLILIAATLVSLANVSDGFSATIAQEFRLSPRLLLFQWGPGGVARPQRIKDNLAWIESKREFYDGAFLYLTQTTFQVMKNRPFSYDTAAKELAPLANLTMSTFKYHMIQVDNDLDSCLPDVFDDWSIIIQNWANVAKACKDFNLVGVAYDNEEYNYGFTNFPDNCRYKNKTLQEYCDQFHLRGKQIMQAMVAQYPEIAILTAHGPYLSEAKGPSDNYVYRIPTYHELTGPFFAGFLDGKGNSELVIDGGETGYMLRTVGQFDTNYTWRKTGIASDDTNCYFIPAALRPIWRSDVSVDFGTYDSDNYNGNPLMTPAIWQTTIARALHRCDHLVWTYLEKIYMLDSNTNEDWAQATRLGKAAGLIGRINPTITAPLPALSKIKSFSCGTMAGMIYYTLPKSCFVSIKYYDLQGKSVCSFVNSYKGVGNYSLKLPSALSRNVYIQEFRAGEFVKKERLVVAK
ncbi:MAG: hypothetical protein PHC61_09360 [Chitinivibrionales bacterium]|nr:hypothetical protein [Chitinivibrionales bacterium]